MNLFNYYLLLFCINHKDEYDSVDECRLEAYDNWYRSNDYDQKQLLVAERNLYYFGGDEDDD